MTASHAGAPRAAAHIPTKQGGRSTTVLYFALLLGAVMLQGAWATGSGIDKDRILGSLLSLRLTDIIPSHGSHLTVQAVGVLLILTGLLMTFVGKAMGKALIALIGFFCLAVLGFLVMEHLHHARPDLFKVTDDQYRMYLLLVSLGAGVLGGAVFLVVLHAVVLGLGVLMGLVLSGTLHHIKIMHGVIDRLPRPAFIAGSIVACVVVTFAIERYIIMTACAVVGSAAFVVGVDIFAKTGLNQQMTEILAGLESSTGPPKHFVFDESTYPLLGVYLAFVVLGVASQLGILRCKQRRNSSRIAVVASRRRDYQPVVEDEARKALVAQPSELKAIVTSLSDSHHHPEYELLDLSNGKVPLKEAPLSAGSSRPLLLVARARV